MIQMGKDETLIPRIHKDTSRVSYETSFKNINMALLVISKNIGLINAKFGIDELSTFKLSVANDLASIKSDINDSLLRTSNELHSMEKRIINQIADLKLAVMSINTVEPVVTEHINTVEPVVTEHINTVEPVVTEHINTVEPKSVEPLWNATRIKQVVGRAVRYKSEPEPETEPELSIEPIELEIAPKPKPKPKPKVIAKKQQEIILEFDEEPVIPQVKKTVRSKKQSK